LAKLFLSTLILVSDFNLIRILWQINTWCWDLQKLQFHYKCIGMSVNV